MLPKKIKIPTKTLNHWKLKRSFGDNAKIASLEDGPSVNSVSLAFSTGKATPHIINKITEFYETV